MDFRNFTKVELIPKKLEIEYDVKSSESMDIPPDWICTKSNIEHAKMKYITAYHEQKPVGHLSYFEDEFCFKVDTLAFKADPKCCVYSLLKYISRKKIAIYDIKHPLIFETLFSLGFEFITRHVGAKGSTKIAICDKLIFDESPHVIHYYHYQSGEDLIEHDPLGGLEFEIKTEKISCSKNFNFYESDINVVNEMVSTKLKVGNSVIVYTINQN